MSSRSNRFVPSLDVLDARVNMSALAATPDAPPEVGHDAADVRIVAAKNEAEASNQGWGAWEVNTPAAPDAGADGRKYKMLVAPLVVDTSADAAQVRHRMFAIVDRTQVAEGAGGANETITIDINRTETAGPGSLTAEAPDETGMLVPAVQKVREAAARMEKL